MARLGHSTPRASLIYQHATERRDRQIAAGLDTILEAAKHASKRHQRRLSPHLDASTSRPNRARQPRYTKKAPLEKGAL